MKEEKRERRGMQFPPRTDPATGRFLTAGGAEKVKQALYLILMTQQTERKANPSFGSTLLSFTFADTSPTMLHMMEHRLRETICAQEPGIEKVELHIHKKDEEEKLYIDMDYMIREEQRKDHLALSFSLTGEAENGR